MVRALIIGTSFPRPTLSRLPRCRGRHRTRGHVQCRSRRALHGGETLMTAHPSSIAADAATGPLFASKTNPRYFAIKVAGAAEDRVVYLTGSHIWNNFQDGMGPGSECGQRPEQLDFADYLAFLKDHGHNFIRLWRWEQF